MNEEQRNHEHGTDDHAGNAHASAQTGAHESAGTHATTDAGAASSGPQSNARTFTEEFKVSGEKVVEKVKELVREGNVRRITLKNDEGKTLIEIPLTIGLIGTLLLPVWAGIGAIAALVANLTIAVEKVVTEDAAAATSNAASDAATDAPVPAGTAE